MARILVVDDEKDLLELLQFNLEVSGHEVLTATTGWEGLEIARSAKLDLVVLDVMLPDLIGFEVLRKLRDKEDTRSVPVIMLTARGEESDVLVGFELGADDYVCKPFSPKELLARIRAVLLRGRETAGGAQCLRFGNLEVDMYSHQARKDGRELTLSPQEYKLLAFLATHPKRVFTRESLLAHAWGADVYVDPRTVDVHIRRLRTQIEDEPSTPRFLETVRGTGYRFNPNVG